MLGCEVWHHDHVQRRHIRRPVFLVVKSTDSAAKFSLQNSDCTTLPVLSPWVNYLTSLCLRFLVFEMGVIVVPLLYGCFEYLISDRM